MPNGVLNIRCSTAAGTLLQQLLGQPIAIVETGEDELCLHYRLTVPVENEAALKKYQQVGEFAARIGGSLNGRLDPERCRLIFRGPDAEIDPDTAWNSLWPVVLTDALRRYGPDEIVESKRPADRDGSDPHPMLAAALNYAKQRDWKVFPARMEDGKKYSWLSKEHAPGGENWGMSNDPEQLRRNFTNPKWRLECGVGVPTGWVNRIVDIEGDTIKGHGVDGLASLQQLEAKYGRLPDTLMAESPTGSLHRIYNHPGPGIKVISRGLPGYPGVDVKGDGGMFIAPPSVRGDGAYRWLNNLPIIDAPDWLIGLITAKGDGKSQPKELPKELPKIPVAEKFQHLNPRHTFNASIIVREFPPQPFEPDIKAGCAWLGAAHDTGGEEFSEKEWSLTTLIAGFLENGHDLAHQFGNRHPDYTHASTEEKWEQKKRAREQGVGWPYCKTIDAAQPAGQSWCQQCPHLAKGKSPLHLGLPQESPGRPFGPYTDYGADAPIPIAWDPAELRISYSNVRHRRWLYGPYLMRGEVTVIGAPGGVGKTALTTGIATVIVTDTVLLDDKIWGNNLKVLSINGEDGKDEITRRMLAFALAHQIAVEAPERFYTIGADDERMQYISFLQTNDRNRTALNVSGFTILESLIDAVCPDVVMLDPFVVFCSGGNMNDPPVMAQVMRKLKSLAIKHNCAILVVHHNKKGGERDDQESISGAAAIVNLARCAIMPVPMTKEEAKEFEILPSERHRYFRLVNAKPNFTPKSEDSPWYRLHSVEIPNPEPPLYEHGDNVQAVARVNLPLPKTASEAADDQKIQQAILDLVERGKLIDGVRYPYSANVTGAKNMRALLDDAMAAVKDATPLRPRPWHSDDLRAVVHAAIDRMKVAGQLFEGTIEKGRFHGSSALYVKRSNPAPPASDDTTAGTPEEESADEGEISESE